VDRLGDDHLCGVDEAGRGPLAGPVAAAAVILPPDFPISLLSDSKAISESRRAVARSEIVARSIWGVGWASAAEIDRLNILRATFLAMERALHALPNAPERVVVDGSIAPVFATLPDLIVNAIVKADSRVPAVMAASILAKTSRDWWMRQYAPLEPAYLLEQHKGYPTQKHRALIGEHGPSRIQRFSFRA
jgi:ribonuclease HII